MIRFFVLLLALLPVLSGCKTIQQRQFANDDSFCKQIGATGSTYTQCMMQRDQQRQQQYAADAQADAQRMAIYSNLAANGTIYPNQPVRHTNCIRTSDITASCTTY